MDEDDVATEEDETLALDDGAMLEDGATEDETARLDDGGISEELERPTALDPGITEITAMDDEVPVTLDMTLALDETATEESPSLAIIAESFAQLRMHPVIANRPKYMPNLDFIIFAFVYGSCEVHARNV